MVKVLTKKKSSEILGAYVVGGPTDSMITLLASAIHNKIDLSNLGKVIFPYPSWSESIKHLADQHSKVNSKPKFEASESKEGPKALLDMLLEMQNNDMEFE